MSRKSNEIGSRNNPLYDKITFAIPDNNYKRITTTDLTSADCSNNTSKGPKQSMTNLNIRYIIFVILIILALVLISGIAIFKMNDYSSGI